MRSAAVAPIARAFLALIVLDAFAAPAGAEPLEVFGYGGVLGEWELAATVTAKTSPRSRLTATLLLDGAECIFAARLSDAYKGTMSCPGRPAMPLTLWVR